MGVEDVLPLARGPEGNLGYLFRVAYQAFRAQLAEALTPLALSVPQYSALSAFQLRREMSSADLARILDVTPQTANSLVHELLGRALLVRQQPAAGRAMTLHLSPDGEGLLQQATVAVRRVERRALETQDPHAQQTIRAWLSLVASSQNETRSPKTRNPAKTNPPVTASRSA